MTYKFKSSVMNCIVEPDHCAICRVAVKGEGADKADLWEAVKCLDQHLYEEQLTLRTLVGHTTVGVKQ